ncbi:MAG TPA: hypothetical protein VFW87_09520 [Pirellulales bacterium]|nr:hypothetical protein [Pirellulales bacterium]
MNILFVANDTNLDLLGLTSEDGAYVTDAQLTCTVADASGQTAAAITLSYLGAPVEAYPDGNYRGVLPAATPLVAGRVYTLTYSASNYGLSLTQQALAQSRMV